MIMPINENIDTIIKALQISAGEIKVKETNLTLNTPLDITLKVDKTLSEYTFKKVANGDLLLENIIAELPVTLALDFINKFKQKEAILTLDQRIWIDLLNTAEVAISAEDDEKLDFPAGSDNLQYLFNLLPNQLQRSIIQTMKRIITF